MKTNLIELAQTSSDHSVLKQLSDSVCTTVRREVARNSFTPSDILDTLAMDCVANVSYMAVQNPRCTVKRDIVENDHPCVQCTLSFMMMNCTNCSSLLEYRSS